MREHVQQEACGGARLQERTAHSPLYAAPPAHSSQAEDALPPLVLDDGALSEVQRLLAGRARGSL